MKTVMVSGKFDPPHEGHIDHIVKASKLGDYLIVIVQPDEGVRFVKQGKCELPLWARVALLKGVLLYYRIKGDVFVGVDIDGRSVRSLRFFNPNIYAKGGDRTSSSLPVDELRTCEEIGCRVAFGIGDLLGSSSQIDVDRSVEA